jgi:hypothetical protein
MLHMTHFPSEIVGQWRNQFRNGRQFVFKIL